MNPRKTLSVIIAAALTMFLCASSLSPQGWANPRLTSDYPPLFSTPQDEPGDTSQSLIADALVLRTRTASLDLSLLADADGTPLSSTGTDQDLALNLFSDVNLHADLLRIEKGAADSFTWVGRLVNGGDGEVYLTVGSGSVHGFITTRRQRFEIVQIGPDRYALSEINWQGLADETTTHVVEPIPDITDSPASIEGMSDDGSIVDVMVLYTTAARDGAGGTTNILNFINSLIASTNQSFANSGVLFRVRLAHAAEVSYDETNLSLPNTLDALVNGTGGFAAAHSLRDIYRADLVSLIVNHFDGATCGMGRSMSPLSPAFAPSAFSIAVRSCALSNFSFAHELGHTMGSVHARGDGVSEQGAFPYSFGYKAPDRLFRTIMAYNCTEGDCPRVNYWSNPDTMYSGQPMGVASSSAQSADNRLSLNNAAGTIASFRESDCPQTGGILLYWNHSYTCANGAGDPGYRLFLSTGKSNLPTSFSDQASSLILPLGWSARLYEHINQGGGNLCKASSDSDFLGETFSNGVGLNDNVSSLEVFPNSTCSSVPGPTTTPLPTWTTAPSATPNNAPWLLEFSKIDRSIFETEFVVRVQWTSDYDAMRLCFDATNCQETSATQLRYVWNTQGWADGFHVARVQYRRKFDQGNWATALSYEETLYLSPNRSGTAPCDGGDGAYLRSGSDCIRLTESHRELSLINWSDRSDLQISVVGSLEAWVYDSPDYQGAARLVRSGQTQSVGGNVSSVNIMPAQPAPPPVPTTPFTCASDTVVLYHMDEWGGHLVEDTCKGIAATRDDSVSWVTGRFGNGININTLADGRSLEFGASPLFNVCPFSFQTWIRWLGHDGLTGRIAGQLGGGGNTGSNKWLLSMGFGSKPTLQIWSAGGGQIATSYRAIGDTDWHLLMFSFDCASSAKLYMDNELVANLTTGGNWPEGATSLEMGSVEGIYRFLGDIDEARITHALLVPHWEAPTASFTTVTSTSGRAPLAVQFADTSSGTISSWLWNFGDGTTSLDRHPTHYFNAPGIYSVSLAVTGPGGTNQIMATQLVVVLAQPTPTTTPGGPLHPYVIYIPAVRK